MEDQPPSNIKDRKCRDRKPSDCDQWFHNGHCEPYAKFYAQFDVMKNTRMSGEHLDGGDTSTPAECGSLCLKSDDCVAFEWHRPNMSCALMKAGAKVHSQGKGRHTDHVSGIKNRGAERTMCKIRVDPHKPQQWADANELAMSRGGRLPTREELISGTPIKTTMDLWHPVIRSDGQTDDWVQIGRHSNARCRSDSGENNYCSRIDNLPSECTSGNYSKKNPCREWLGKDGWCGNEHKDDGTDCRPMEFDRNEGTGHKTLRVFGVDPYVKTLGGYVYGTPHTAEQACSAEGLRLCRKQELIDKNICTFGWTSDAGTGYPMANGKAFYAEKASHANPEERKKKGWCGGNTNGWRAGGYSRKAAAHCCKNYSEDGESMCMCPANQWLNNDGVCQPKTTSCPEGSLLVESNKPLYDNSCVKMVDKECPDGYREANHVDCRDRLAGCVGNKTICVPDNFNPCSSNQWLNNGVCQPKTTSCSKGSLLVESNNKDEDNYCADIPYFEKESICGENYSSSSIKHSDWHQWWGPNGYVKSSGEKKENHIERIKEVCEKHCREKNCTYFKIQKDECYAYSDSCSGTYSKADIKAGKYYHDGLNKRHANNCPETGCNGDYDFWRGRRVKSAIDSYKSYYKIYEHYVPSPCGADQWYDKDNENANTTHTRVQGKSNTNTIAYADTRPRVPHYNIKRLY